MSETFTNEEDEEVMTISKLEAEPATKEASIPDYHPCEVAKGAGGIFGQFGGGRLKNMFFAVTTIFGRLLKKCVSQPVFAHCTGDGSTAPENMMYRDLAGNGTL